jgi:hypothetical protein
MTKQIGVIAKLSGPVEIINAHGQKHFAHEGENLFEGDKVITAPGESGPVNNAENNTSGKTDPSNSPNGGGSLSVNDLLTDGKHELVFDEIAVGKSDKTTTTVHIEDSTTHETVQDLTFHSHVDHSVQAIMDELSKGNSHTG